MSINWNSFAHGFEVTWLTCSSACSCSQGLGLWLPKLEAEKNSKELNKAGMLWLTVFIPQLLKILIVPLMTEIVTIAVRPATASHLLTIRLPSPMLLCTSSLCRWDCHSSCYFRAIPGIPAMTLSKVTILIIQSGGLSGGFWKPSTFSSWYVVSKMQLTVFGCFNLRW